MDDKSQPDGRRHCVRCLRTVYEYEPRRYAAGGVLCEDCASEQDEAARQREREALDDLPF